jgi:hypothetical protein
LRCCITGRREKCPFIKYLDAGNGWVKTCVISPVTIYPPSTFKDETMLSKALLTMYPWNFTGCFTTIRPDSAAASQAAQRGTLPTLARATMIPGAVRGLY